MTLDYFQQYTTGDTAKPAKNTRGDNKREKRLERNRESARKCRKKRKAYVGDIEERCQGLEEDNAILQLENQRLHEIIQQLQTGMCPDSKRLKSEIGVSMATDFSESAAGELFSAGHLDHLPAPMPACRDHFGDFECQSGGDTYRTSGDDSLLGTSAPSSPCTSGESDALGQSAMVAPDKLHCELASLLPPGDATDEDADVLLRPCVKLEDVVAMDLPPTCSTECEMKNLGNPEDFLSQGLMESLTSDSCGDLVSTFVNDLPGNDVPVSVSLDDFLEI